MLLLLHGFPTSSHDFRLVHASLNARYRIIAPDLLSFGATDRLRGADATVRAPDSLCASLCGRVRRPMWSQTRCALSGTCTRARWIDQSADARVEPRAYMLQVSVAEQADFVLALLAARGVARYHVLAHDYGDTVLQELLARELEVNVGRGGNSEPGGNGPTTARMLSAVLLNGGVVPGAHRALPIQTLLAAQPWIARFVPEFAARRSLERTFAVPQAREELDAMVAATYHKGGKAALGTLLAYIEERKVHEGRWVGALRRTAVPLRFVCGAEDPISGEHMAEAFTAEVGDGADVVLLRGVGHWPQLEAPQAVVAAVRRFHREIGGVGAADKTQDAET